MLIHGYSGISCITYHNPNLALSNVSKLLISFHLKIIFPSDGNNHIIALARVVLPLQLCPSKAKISHFFNVKSIFLIILFQLIKTVIFSKINISY